MSETPKRPTPSRPAARKPADAKKPVEKKPSSKDSSTKESGSKGNGKKGILIGIVVILLAINGVQFFLGEQKKKELNTTIETKNDELKAYSIQVDSLQQEARKQLEQIKELGGDTTALYAQIKELEEAKEKFRKSAAWSNSQLRTLKSQLNGHKTLLVERDKKIADLENQISLLDSTNKQQLVVIQEKVDAIAALERVEEELNDKVESAQVLTAGSYKFKPYKKNGKSLTKIQPYKGKQIAKLEISFRLMPNAVAPVENKTVYTQVVDPNGNIITLADSQTFETEDGEEIFYTMTSDEMYERAGTTVVYSFENPNDYITEQDENVYQVISYVDGVQIGSSSFKTR